MSIDDTIQTSPVLATENPMCTYCSTSGYEPLGLLSRTVYNCGHSAHRECATEMDGCGVYGCRDKLTVENFLTPLTIEKSMGKGNIRDIVAIGAYSAALFTGFIAFNAVVGNMDERMQRDIESRYEFFERDTAIALSCVINLGVYTTLGLLISPETAVLGAGYGYVEIAIRTLMGPFDKAVPSLPGYIIGKCTQPKQKLLK